MTHSIVHSTKQYSAATALKHLRTISRVHTFEKATISYPWARIKTERFDNDDVQYQLLLTWNGGMTSSFLDIIVHILVHLLVIRILQLHFQAGFILKIANDVNQASFIASPIIAENTILKRDVKYTRSIYHLFNQSQRVCSYFCLFYFIIEYCTSYSASTTHISSLQIKTHHSTLHQIILHDITAHYINIKLQHTAAHRIT